MKEPQPSTDVFGLLREYERMAPGKPRIGRSLRASDDVVRFGQVPHLAFAPASTETDEVGSGDKVAHLRVYFMGLLGPMGPMPTQMSELAIYEERYAKDHPYAAFLDVLANRMVQLFFRSWADAEPAANLDRPGGDHFQQYAGALGALIDASPHDEPDRIALALLGFAGQTAARRSPAAIVDAASAMLGVSAELIEFVGMWHDVPPGDASTIGLGGRFNQLGRGATIGSRTYTVQDACLIRLRFNKLSAFEAHLPGASHHATAMAVLKSLIPAHLLWRVEFELPASEAPPSSLGKTTKLGWTSWLGASPGGAPRRDLRLNPPSGHASNPDRPPIH